MLFHLKEWLPLAVSFCAFLISAMFGWASQSDRRNAARLSRERDLHAWTRDVGNVYEALLASDAAEKTRATYRLSVLIDYGRLMFPNDRTQLANEYPNGLRSSVLDPLVETRNRYLRNLIPSCAEENKKTAAGLARVYKPTGQPHDCIFCFHLARSTRQTSI